MILYLFKLQTDTIHARTHIDCLVKRKGKIIKTRPYGQKKKQVLHLFRLLLLRNKKNLDRITLRITFTRVMVPVHYSCTIYNSGPLKSVWSDPLGVPSDKRTLPNRLDSARPLLALLIVNNDVKFAFHCYLGTAENRTVLHEQTMDIYFINFNEITLLNFNVF